MLNVHVFFSDYERIKVGHLPLRAPSLTHTHTHTRAHTL